MSSANQLVKVGLKILFKNLTALGVFAVTTIYYGLFTHYQSFRRVGKLEDYNEKKVILVFSGCPISIWMISRTRLPGLGRANR